MSNFKLKDALKKHNSEKGNKMSQLELSKKIFPDHNPKTALYHVSMASNGHAFGRFTPEIIKRTCDILDCDPNFLFDYKPKNK